MFPRLVLQFLGLPQVHLDSEPVVLDRRKAIALVAYLAVNDIGHPRQEYARESLSGLLWPDYEQGKAFSNLRRTIWEVHQAIGEDWLIASRESVRLNPDIRVDVDVARFQDLLSQAHQQTDISIRIALLVDAVKLYRNHFLTGFNLKDAYPFSEWTFSKSEDLRRQLTEALFLLSEDYCALGQADKAIPYSRRLVSLDPLNESAHRQLMNVYMLAGQHAAAMKQYQSCEQILRREMDLDPQPETRALYKKIRKAGMERVHIEKPIEIITPKHNLPSQISSFIGREKEQDEIISLLSKHRLVTLAGVGGIGKTRVALQLSQNALHDFPDGVWFIPLDSLSDPALVPQTVAAVFGIREGSSDQPLLERLTFSLRGKTTLLLLDNCEHLIEACVQLIRTLLQNCPGLKVIATSRETLNMTGEAIFYLPTLSLPDHNTLPEKLADYESVQLFTERAGLSQSSFKMTKENAPAVMDICRKVDGIPLAIELAAARVDILQVEEILKQLHTSFALLAGENRAALPRHQTLQASMNWSWGLLSEAEQTFLCQLSVFAGGWTLESAQAVCDGDALSLTNTLVKKSLMIVDRKTGRETRYRFHETVRQYLRGKLAASGEEEIVRTRHLGYFQSFSKQAEQALRGPAQLEWLAYLNEERDNLHAALGWAEKTDVESGLSVVRYWVNCDLQSGKFWLSKLLHRLDSTSDPRARANGLNAYGKILFNQQQFEMMITTAEECLALYRAIGDQKGEIDGLLLLGSALATFSNPIADKTEILALVQQAHELADSVGDVQQQVDALWQLGILDQTNRFVHWDKAIALARRLENWTWLANCLSLMGYFLVLDNKLEKAQMSLDEATALYKQLNLKPIINNPLLGYGQLALFHLDLEKARACFQEISRISIDFGSRQPYLWAQVHLGYVAVRQGSFIEARQLFAEGIREFQKDKYAIGVVFSLEGMAELFIAIEKPESAALLIGWADATRKEINDNRPRLEQADVDKTIAACIAKMGEAAFSDAYDEGRKMSLEEAVQYALEEHR